MSQEKVDVLFLIVGKQVTVSKRNIMRMLCLVGVVKSMSNHKISIRNECLKVLPNFYCKFSIVQEKNLVVLFYPVEIRKLSY